ncbi:septum formation family protein [Nonomuraea typhae]|uniref:septum formation family protein n=1 Tax=Nonomuraea typhae TaxID=2603600 RepID=UPI0012F96780|nr:septum formation family protein [Nonomuraea typhae]
MSRSSDRNAAVVAELWEIAGPKMYRRNAFRVTGLGTLADAGTVRGRQQRVSAAMSAGADTDLDGDADEFRVAFDRIRDAPRRLVHELFWHWDAPDTTCSCTRSLHLDHDAAVRAHSAALDREAQLTAPDAAQQRELARLWGEAGRQWAALLRRAAFWDHVRHRIQRLDDRRLDDSAVDLLRPELAAFLVKPLVELAASADDPARLAEAARAWPVPSSVLDDEFESIAAPLFETLQAQLKQAVDAGDPYKTVTAVQNSVLPLLNRLDGLFPRGQHHRVANARDDAATAINNSAHSVICASGVLDDAAAREWLTLAQGVTDDGTLRQLLGRNLAELDQLVKALDQVGNQVKQLVAAGQSRAAKSVLRQLLAQAGDGAGSGALAELLDQADTWDGPLVWRTGNAGKTATRRPRRAPSRPAWSPSPVRARRIRWGVIIAFAVAVILVVVWMIDMSVASAPTPPVVTPTATVTATLEKTKQPPELAMLSAYSSKDNAPAGTCLATKQGWDDFEKKPGVPTVPCDEPHWGEVLGYPGLSRTADYPGHDQAIALSRFHCGRMLDYQQLPASYEFAYLYPDYAFWKSGGKHATCIVHRADNALLTSGRVIRLKGPLPDDVATRMELSSHVIWANAPVGSCVRTKKDFKRTVFYLSIVLCSQAHWARILGYPVLYKRGTKWPGQKRVLAKAEAACLRLGKSRHTASRTVHTVWPSKSFFTGTKEPRYATCLIYRTDNKPMRG